MNGQFKEKSMRYGVAMLTKTNEVCFVTHVKGSEIGIEKGNAWITESKVDADQVYLRMLSSGHFCFVMRITTGFEDDFNNPKDFTFGELKNKWKD